LFVEKRRCNCEIRFCVLQVNRSFTLGSSYVEHCATSPSIATEFADASATIIGVEDDDDEKDYVRHMRGLFHLQLPPPYF